MKTKAYYDWQEDDSMVVIGKDWYDVKKRWPDWDNAHNKKEAEPDNHFNAIREAMESIGCEEIGDCIYDVEGMTEEGIVKLMGEKGFILVKKDL